jgi:hypothetical protein
MAALPVLALQFCMNVIPKGRETCSARVSKRYFLHDIARYKLCCVFCALWSPERMRDDVL